MCDSDKVVLMSYSPAVLSVRPVAELVREVLVQGGGGRVGAAPREPPASVSCSVCGQIHWWVRSHCKTQIYTTEA